MNTPAITASVPASSADVTKAPFRDNAAGNTSFNDILNKEIADRRPSGNTNVSSAQDASGPGKKENATSTASSQAAEEAPSKESLDTDKTDVDVSAEQMLMIAGQLIPIIPDTQAGVGKTDDTSVMAGMAPANGITSALSSGENTLANLLGDTVKDKTAKGQDSLGAASGKESDAELLKNIDLSKEGASLSADLSAAKQNSMQNAPLTALVPASPELSAELSAESIEESLPDFAASLNAMQKAADTVAQTAVNTSERIAPQVGTSAWNQAIGQKIVWMVGSEQQSASLTLNPPDLGPMQVVLSVSSTQANASFYSPHAEVREALEAALPKLREMLGDAGIQLGQANVNAGTPQQQGSYAPTFTASAHTSNTHDSLSVTQVPSTPVSRMVREGLVDTFA